MNDVDFDRLRKVVDKTFEASGIDDLRSDMMYMIAKYQLFAIAREYYELTGCYSSKEKRQEWAKKLFLSESEVCKLIYHNTKIKK